MTNTENGRMTKGERDELGRLARRHEKIAKAQVQERAAELEADLEEQLATVYSFDDDDVWREVTEAAEAAVGAAKANADVKIAERCEQLGIPDWARPSLAAGVLWSGRGENATAERRVELRRVGKTRIQAYAKKAVAEIERRSVAWQTELLTSGLASDDAKRLLAAMPTAEQLMPTLDVAELRDEVETEPKGRVAIRKNREALAELNRDGFARRYERERELGQLGLPRDVLDDEGAST